VWLIGSLSCSDSAVGADSYREPQLIAEKKRKADDPIVRVDPETLTLPKDYQRQATKVAVLCKLSPHAKERWEAAAFSGVVLRANELVLVTVTGEAYGGGANDRSKSFDADGVPKGAQPGSGPQSGGDMPLILGPPANYYSVIATLRKKGESKRRLMERNEWFLVGKSLAFRPKQEGELVFLFHDNIYRDNWLPAYLDNEGGFDVSIVKLGASSAYPIQHTRFPTDSIRATIIANFRLARCPVTAHPERPMVVTP
jgi:hypothetical protein